MSINALNYSDLASIFINKDNIFYNFHIDKVNKDTLLFYGNSYNEGTLNNDYSNNLLRLLSDNLPDMLWAKDIQGRYIFANKAICDNLLMAKDTKEPLGKTDIFFVKREREKYSHNKQWHTFGELCYNSDEIVLEKQKNLRFEEYGNIKGKMTYLEVHKAPFINKEGRLIGTLGSGRDITKEVFTKKQLKEQEELLFHQSKMAAIGEMLQNIAHQWRQPLSGISSLSSSIIIQEKMNLLNKKTLLESMENILSSVDYLSQTIDNFRYFFKPEKEKKAFSANNIIERLLILVNSQIKTYQIKIVTNIEDININSYENEFLQVLINITNNAIDALRVNEVFPKLILIDIYEKDKNIIVTIQDNAKGVPLNIIDNIFEPYFTTKHKKQGTGIGLYMSSEIVTKHIKGSIKVKNIDFSYEDRKFSGAVFTIILNNEKRRITDEIL